MSAFFASALKRPALACAALYMGQPMKLDFLRAGFCPPGAVYFIFRG